MGTSIYMKESSNTLLKKRPEPTPYNPAFIDVEDAINTDNPPSSNINPNKDRNSSSSKKPINSTSVKIETYKDLEVEELIRNFTNELLSAKTFAEKKPILNRLYRRTNITKKNGHIHRFLIFQLITEFSKSTTYQSKVFSLTTLKRALEFCTGLEYEFKKTLMETIMLHLEIEENHDHLVLL